MAREAEQRKRRKVQLALAACVRGMRLLGGAGVRWWREQRLSEANRGVDAALAEAKSLQQQGRWPDALAAARRAEVLSPGADERLAAQVRTALADFRMLTDLEQAPLAIADRRDDANDYAGAEEALCGGLSRLWRRCLGPLAGGIGPAIARQRDSRGDRRRLGFLGRHTHPWSAI